jgi:hypothetical protein
MPDPERLEPLNNPSTLFGTILKALFKTDVGRICEKGQKKKKQRKD